MEEITLGGRPDLKCANLVATRLLENIFLTLRHIRDIKDQSQFSDIYIQEVTEDFRPSFKSHSLPPKEEEEMTKPNDLLVLLS